MKKTCMNCQYYKRYYLKETYFFSKTSCGYCREHQKTTEAHEVCECWKKSSHNLRSLRHMLSIETLNAMSESIAAVRCILFENREEEEAEEREKLVSEPQK